MSDMSLDIYDYLFNLYRPVQEHVWAISSNCILKNQKRRNPWAL